MLTKPILSPSLDYSVSEGKDAYFSFSNFPMKLALYFSSGRHSIHVCLLINYTQQNCPCWSSSGKRKGREKVTRQWPESDYVCFIADQTVEEATSSLASLPGLNLRLDDHGYMRAVGSGKPGATMSMSSQNVRKSPSNVGRMHWRC